MILFCIKNCPFLRRENVCETRLCNYVLHSKRLVEVSFGKIAISHFLRVSFTLLFIFKSFVIKFSSICRNFTLIALKRFTNDFFFQFCIFIHFFPFEYAQSIELEKKIVAYQIDATLYIYPATKSIENIVWKSMKRKRRRERY